MLQNSLGTSDLTVSSLGMGCVTFGREIDEATSFRVLDRALEQGITLFDTAATYGQGASEQVLGHWLASRKTREQIVLATKVHGTLSRDHILQSCDESLQRLQTDHIDLFQLHHWDQETPAEESLQALADLVQSGKVRFIGCSNWSADQVAIAADFCRQNQLPQFVSVQPPYNLVQRDIEQDLLPLCSEQNIGVLSYSPLAAGFLSGKYQRNQPIPSGSRFDVIPGHQPIYFTDHGFDALDRLQTAAQQSGHTMVQLALAWTIAQPGITSVLIGARNTDQVDQALTAAKLAATSDLQAFKL